MGYECLKSLLLVAQYVLLMLNTFYFWVIVYDFHSGIWSTHSTFNHNLELLQLRRHLTSNYCVSKRILSLLQLLLSNISIFSHQNLISTNPHLFWLTLILFLFGFLYLQAHGQSSTLEYDMKLSKKVHISCWVLCSNIGQIWTIVY